MTGIYIIAEKAARGNRNPNTPKRTRTRTRTRTSPKKAPEPLFLSLKPTCFQAVAMRPVLSEQAQREIHAIPARDHEGWQTIPNDRDWLDHHHHHPSSATQIEIPMQMGSVQTLQFIGFNDNTVGELYDSWCPEAAEGEDSLLQHAKGHLAKTYDRATGIKELRRLLPAMGMSRAFNDKIWEMADQIRRDHRFANTTVERTNIKQWAELEIGTRFKALQNLNNRILGLRIERLNQASYGLSHRNGNSKDGAPDGFRKRNGLLEPTYHEFPQLPAGPRIWAFNPAMMGNFRAVPMEDGRIKYVSQEPTGYTVPNNDGTQNVYVGRHQAPTGYGDQLGRGLGGGAPNFGQGQPVGGSFQARSCVEEQSQAQREGQLPAGDGPAPGAMQQAVTGYVNPQGHGTTPNYGLIAQNQFHVQDQLRAQPVGQHPAWDGRPAPNAQLYNPRGYAPIQFGPQAYAPVWTNWGGNWMNGDAPPPYSAQPPYQ